MKKHNIKLVLVIVFIFVIGFVSINGGLLDKDKITKNIINVSENSIEFDSPYENLNELAKNNKRVARILENKEEYPEFLLEALSKNTELIDYVLDYNDNNGKVLSNDIGNVKKGDYPLLLQYDKRWGYAYYGEYNLAISGCGPTTIAMVVAGLTGRNDVTPYTVAKYAMENNYYSESGTKWALMKEGIKHFGIKSRELNNSKKLIFKELEKGHPIICSMKPGIFTTTGHFIAIVGIKDNKFIVHDPNSKKKSKGLWSYEEIKDEIRNMWVFEKKI
ncbi:putative uncharacterized protein [Clostridium sp. CAG:762]|nr:putative uncharacterized protein [Clostridium sp. CAG:762]